MLALTYKEKTIEYINGKCNFSPDTIYPEYPWGSSEISKEKNNVYSLFRECLYEAKLDMDNFGTSTWNPLGNWIKKGNTVLIKANWVENKNKNKKVNDNLRCIVTQPSVIRAIVDYVFIAQQGEGKIIIGDAPMQGCELEKLFEITGYTQLFAFMSSKDINFEICDFRKYHDEAVYNGVLSKPIMTENSAGGVLVDLRNLSMHASKDYMKPKYRVTQYRESDTTNFHSKGSHVYEVNKIPLMVDAIINVPKPKTHRLAGFTASIKNFIGITYEKASLPHRIEGDKHSGGDAYLKQSFWKRRMAFFDEQRTNYSIAGKYFTAKIADIFMKVCYVLGVITTGDQYRIGSWYGNDTIWRTAIDLNYIVRRADCNGTLFNNNLRNVITIGDMITCGQGNGPVSSFPKQLNMIMISDNGLLFDRVFCEIMGFEKKYFKMFSDKKSLNIFGFDNQDDLEEETAIVNGKYIKIKDFSGLKSWRFTPHSCWRGHVEKNV